jgi:DNA-binding beta-propeller fold protein YncE
MPGVTQLSPMKATFLVLASIGILSSISAAERSAAIFAGTGKAGYSGDGGPATEAAMNNPFGLVRGPDGALYFCDTGNHRIRRIGKDGMISTVAGTGMAGYSGDGGAATEADLNEPYEIRFDMEGNLYFVERLNHTVRRIDAKAGTLSLVAGTGGRAGFGGDGGPATKALLNQPHSIQFGPGERELFVCDILNHRVRVLDLKSGRIRTFAGNGKKGATPDGEAISEKLPLSGPRALDIDHEGNLWLALREGNTVYRFDLKAGTVHHLAGTGESGFTGNGGPALKATLSGPKGLSVGHDGNVYLADTESHSVRMIDLSQAPPTLEILLGDGKKGADLRHLARPHGIFVDEDGTVYIGDSENHRIVVVR